MNLKNITTGAGVMVVTVAMAGCFGGSGTWTKPATDSKTQQYYQDLSQCRVMRNQANNDDVLDNCMKGKGYTKS